MAAKLHVIAQGKNMKSKYIKEFSTAFALILLFLLGANFAAFGQGHGKGNRRDRAGDDDRGGGHRERGDNRREFRSERRGENNHDQRRSHIESRRQQAQSDWNSQRQQEWSDRESARQQRHSDWNSRRQQERSDLKSRRQQRQSDWNSRWQQQRSDRESRRQQEWSDRNSREPRSSAWRGRRQSDDDDERRARWGRQRRGNRQVYSYPNQGQIIWGNIWNDGNSRWRNGQRYRNEQRRDWKEEQKARRRYERQQRIYFRNYDRNQSGYYYDNDYYRDDYGYNDGSNWKQQLLRVIIGNVIGSRLGGDGPNFIPQFQPNYDPSPYNYGNDSIYYNTPQRYYGIPYNDAYEPNYDYGNASFGDGSLAGGLLNSLPIAELIERFAGGGIASEILSNVLAQGYDQGFIAGRAARQNGYGDRYYHDPYAYEGGVYDPYSVCMGENRQILSEGYELGYQDALNRQTEYDPRSDGNVDLVSLLLNNVLGSI